MHGHKCQLAQVQGVKECVSGGPGGGSIQHMSIESSGGWLTRKGRNLRKRGGNGHPAAWSQGPRAVFNSGVPKDVGLSAASQGFSHRSSIKREGAKAPGTAVLGREGASRRGE